MASATAVQQSLWKPLESALDRNRREIDPHSNDLHCEMADVWPRNEDVFLSEIIRLPSLL